MELAFAIHLAIVQFFHFLSSVALQTYNFFDQILASEGLNTKWDNSFKIKDSP